MDEFQVPEVPNLPEKLSKTKHGSREERLLIAQRRTALVELRLSGCSFQEIAEALGYKSAANASKDFSRVLDKQIMSQSQTIEQWRQAEILKLDRMLKALDRGIQLGNTRAIDSALKIMERRAKYLGLDKPQQVQVMTIDAIDAEIARLEAEVRTKAGPETTAPQSAKVSDGEDA